ncbi:hypothetical protein FPQ18DRAFT_135244 [Pyronema domesticum]|uniref:holo-[acyl-carrier-protein] synthase n=1 Tax=Pyronema omphalodes (strain CBS 100304) TaxID=1076935 RepID=U4KWZ5_PYROM|nr:hypothetical protein FPQ18DRAFT_135244 [Pyronema domesticum]CCX06492.1 Similar to L-aminoadipate-semialdehyde dehydrogenase-phosphopantetheinyl transferase; acc. no. Q6DJH2 [Pyronema omphalodes CBS 100304]
MPLLRHLLDCTSLPVSALCTRNPPLLPDTAINKAQRYHFPQDQALSFGSSLLQRHIVCTHYQHTLLSAPLETEADTKRPFHTASATSAKDGQTIVEDYNVSHHRSPEGEKSLCILAAITSSVDGNRNKCRRIGVDVVPTVHPRDEKEFVSMMCDKEAGVFTDYEAATIMAAGGDGERTRCLYLHWGLKEAYVKAMGTGIVGELRGIEFRGVPDVRDFGEGRREVEVWVEGRDETGKWYVEVSFIGGNKEREGFYVAVCCDRTAVTEEDKKGQWREVTVEEVLRECGVE